MATTRHSHSHKWATFMCSACFVELGIRSMKKYTNIFYKLIHVWCCHINGQENFILLSEKMGWKVMYMYSGAKIMMDYGLMDICMCELYHWPPFSISACQPDPDSEICPHQLQVIGAKYIHRSSHDVVNWKKRTKFQHAIDCELSKIDKGTYIRIYEEDAKNHK